MQKSEVDTAQPPSGSRTSEGIDLSSEALKSGISKPGAVKPPDHAWYVVFVLMVCYTLSFIDRQILSLLVGPIKADLGVSDKELGLLGGLAFGIFYTLLGLPMGRIVDRSSRRNLIAVGVFFWSLMTALCAVARSYWALFLARMGVGIGEATLGPSAFSLISDYFPRERLGKALSVYSAGIFIGAGMALIVGGAVSEAVSTLPPVTVPLLGTMASWRLTFLIVGLPGLLVGLLMYTVREPLRSNLLKDADGKVTQLSFGDALDQMKLRWRSVVGVSLALGTQAMCNYAQQFWAPSLFGRVYGWNKQQTGVVLGLMILITGCIGMYVGGSLCDSWARKRIREAPLKVGVISTIGAGIFFSLAMAYQQVTWTLVLLAPALFFLAMPVGSSYAALQMIFPNQVRGQVSALLIFTINLLGLIPGPLLVGALNDSLGEDKVGYSLLITVGLASLVSATLFRITYGPYRKHYEMMQDGE
jgi:MFS family permease